jgi:hypothetical protein
MSHHFCGDPQESKNSGGYGPAIENCTEDDAGHFVAGNGEYSSYVNFCPFCGEKAPAAIPLKEFVIELRSGGYFQTLDADHSGPLKSAARFPTKEAATRFMDEHEWIYMHGGAALPDPA